MDVNVLFNDASDGATFGPFLVGNSSDWVAFAAWLDDLDGEFPKLKSLATEGKCQGTDALAAEIELALEQKWSPVAELLGDCIGVGDKTETIMVVD